MSGNVKYGKQSPHKYIHDFESKLYDSSANTEFCDCDKVEYDCWWYLPVSAGMIVLSFVTGYIVGVIK